MPAGTHTVTVEYDDDLGCSTSASIDIVVAPAVDATIEAIPDLCESASSTIFSAADNGGLDGELRGMHHACRHL